MGVGPEAVELIRNLHDNGHLEKLESIIELGSQEVPTSDWHQNWARRTVKSLTGADPKSSPLTIQEFYEAFGISEYACIDADGANDALVYDLNCDISKSYEAHRTYDIVTNFGTTEHVFNQYNCFKNIHDLLAVGGLSIHIVPFGGYLNHGYFNYHPSFFVDLGLANNYDIIGIWFSAETSQLRNTIPIPYSDELMNVLHKLCLSGHFLHTPMDNCTSLEVVFRKRTDKPFKCPFDVGSNDKYINKLQNDYEPISLSDRNQILNPPKTIKIKSRADIRRLLHMPSINEDGNVTRSQSRWERVKEDPTVMLTMVKNYVKRWFKLGH